MKFECIVQVLKLHLKKCLYNVFHHIYAILKKLLKFLAMERAFSSTNAMVLSSKTAVVNERHPL